MHRFHIVDVFATERYAGNQLAVVTDAGDLTGKEMLAIADEMNYSETTFVTGPPTDSGWPVRIFTPAEEVPFAGHPTLGTASVVREHLAEGKPETVTLDLAVGGVPVEARVDGDHERLWMRQQPPTFDEQVPHEELAGVLGLSPDRLNRDWPAQVVSTGLPTVIVPLVDRAALGSITLDRAAYDALVEGYGAKLVLAVCREPRATDNNLAVRVFAPYYDVPEDPATGSANGCLAAYLGRHGYLGSPPVTARVEQGYELGRPSILSLAVDGAGDTVEVGGRVLAVARGELL